MAEASVMFSIPAIEEFCGKVREGVTASGGAGEFFRTLTADARPTFLHTLPMPADRSILRRLLDDAPFREMFIDNIKEAEDRKFIQAFLEGWRTWSVTNPILAQDLEILTVSPIDILIQ